MKVIYKTYLLILILLNSSASLFAQDGYPSDYFRSPLEMRLLLSGTFGEIRSNHFHSGIDIKTAGVEGAPVYAVADGYVSRVKVSAYGFGKAMYVTHPNGYVSVYGHLSKYSRKIGDHIRNEQYRLESFEIELFPGETDFPVKKGEIIAYTGNSGSSGGPHLHFEIRDGASQEPINPLLFGFPVKDFIKPAISSIKIYPEDELSKINGKNKAVRYQAEGWGAEHRLSGSPAIKLSGNISFAIQVHDQQNDTDNKNGPYAVRLLIDSKEVFSFKMESFSFEDTRYVNSLLDYEEYVRNNVRLQQTRIDPGNRLDIYGETLNKGIFTFDDTLTHTVRYEVTDVAGNMSVLAFRAKAEKFVNQQGNGSGFQVPGSNQNDPNSSDQISIFNYTTPNSFYNGSVSLSAPKGVFYDSFNFRYDSLKQIPGTFSVVHRIHDRYTPVHDNMTLAIKPLNLPDDLKEKAVIVKVKEDGVGYTSVGGKWESGKVTTMIKEFGDFTIAIDTVPPKIKAVNPGVFSKMAGQKEIRITISDELSGIASYRGLMNGKWILMEYDAKNNVLIYTVDEHLAPGQNTLLLEVRDGKSNRAYYSARLIL